jgi:hypothetical protein
MTSSCSKVLYDFQLLYKQEFEERSNMQNKPRAVVKIEFAKLARIHQ